MLGFSGIACGEPDNAEAAAAPVSEGPIELFFGVAFRQKGDQPLSSENRLAVSRIQGTEHAVDIRAIPLKRALKVYQGSDSACLLHMPQKLTADELVSRPVTVNHYWFYVPMDSIASSYADVSLVGTVFDAKNRLTADDMASFRWLFAVNWESVVHLVRKGRVDAVTLGASALETVKNADAGLRRLSPTPFISIPLAVHCKPTDRNAAFIASLDKGLRD